WSGAPSSADLATINGLTRRGYTGHEMLDSTALIHMNGRVQDPVVGRFISADPMLDPRLGVHAWNRYGYVGNNPLTFSDPSGFTSRGSERPHVAWLNGDQHPAADVEVVMENGLETVMAYGRRESSISLDLVQLMEVPHPGGGGGGDGVSGGGSGGGSGAPADGPPEAPKPKDPIPKPCPPVKKPQASTLGQNVGKGAEHGAAAGAAAGAIAGARYGARFATSEAVHYSFSAITRIGATSEAVYGGAAGGAVAGAAPGALVGALLGLAYTAASGDGWLRFLGQTSCSDKWTADSRVDRLCPLDGAGSSSRSWSALASGWITPRQR
ncbi:MAG: RHS repeat-associated core domain-containing protein, partial [Steroidobacteraceae bacterium]